MITGWIYAVIRNQTPEAILYDISLPELFNKRRDAEKRKAYWNRINGRGFARIMKWPVRTQQETSKDD